MNSLDWIAIAITCFAALGGLIDQPDAGMRGPAAQLVVSDETLGRAAAACLMGVASPAVTVSARAGVLTLEGPVASAEERVRIVRLVRELPGVRGVEDRLGRAP